MFKKLIVGILVLLMCALTIMCNSSDNEQKADVQNISVEQLKQMMENKDFTLINVHIPYAGEIPKTDTFIPFNKIEDNKNKLPANKDAKIVVYCRSDNMSGKASKKLIDIGYTNVYDVKGGMRAWEKAGYELLDKSEIKNKL